MDDLFLALLLVSLICLIVGLIKPNAFNRLMKKELTRKNVGLIFGGAFIVFFVLFGITTEPIEKETPEVEPATQQEEITENEETEPEPTPDPELEKTTEPTQETTQEEVAEQEATEPEPTPAPEPQPEPKWVEIIDFTARDASKQSETFTLLGGKQKLSYVVSGDEQSEGMCAIYVMDEGKDLMTDGGFPVIMQDGNKSGETLMRKPAGDYYLDLQVGWGSCAVEILELR